VKRYFQRRGKRRGRRLYGQRWQAESVFSRSKRRLGSALRARQWPNQKKEILLRVLTHNLLILRRKTWDFDRAKPLLNGVPFP
jgi:hypothetical protein